MKKKTVSISNQCYDKLNGYFNNNHKTGEFLTYVIEQITSQLDDHKIIVLKIDTSKIN